MQGSTGVRILITVGPVLLWQGRQKQTGRIMMMTSTAQDAANDFATLKADLASLRQDVAALVSHATAGTKRDAGVAAQAVDDTVRDLYRNATARGEQSTKVIADQIVERPILTLLIVMSAAFIGGRLLSR
jgi:hypothetical protein